MYPSSLSSDVDNMPRSQSLDDGSNVVAEAGKVKRKFESKLWIGFLAQFFYLELRDVVFENNFFYQNGSHYES